MAAGCKMRGRKSAQAAWRDPCRPGAMRGWVLRGTGSANRESTRWAWKRDGFRDTGVVAAEGRRVHGMGPKRTCGDDERPQVVEICRRRDSHVVGVPSMTVLPSERGEGLRSSSRVLLRRGQGCRKIMTVGEETLGDGAHVLWGHFGLRCHQYAPIFRRYRNSAWPEV